MGQTIAQKIIARAAGQDTVTPGDYLMVKPDYTVGCELYWPMHAKHLRELGIDKFANPEKVILAIDHTIYTSSSTSYEALQKDMRGFLAKAEFKNFFDVGRGGLRHLIMVEKGFARPGMFVFSDEPNIAAIGAFGAMNMPISWEIIVTMVSDENWIQVPETARIDLVGELKPGVYVRDLVQAINRDFAASDKLLPMCVEFGGPGISGLSLDNRQGLLACAYHAGANTAVMEVDELALAYVDERAEGRPYTVFEADADADYAIQVQYDLSELEPFVTAPPTQSNVVPVGDVAGTAVTQATIGSCASNRLDDLRAAAEILKGRKIAPLVTMYISPGSQEIYATAAREGLLEIFVEAGATVMSPGCNTCWGHIGTLADGDVSISTHQENYRGRNGSTEADIYLGSPYTVAASAVAGKITDPRELMTE